MYASSSPTKQGKHKSWIDRPHTSRVSQTGFKSLFSGKLFNGPTLSHRDRNMSKLSRSFISRRRVGLFVALLLFCFSFVVFIFDLHFTALTNLPNGDSSNSSYVSLISDPLNQKGYENDMAEFIRHPLNNTNKHFSEKLSIPEFNESKKSLESDHPSTESSNAKEAIDLKADDLQSKRKSFELNAVSTDKEMEYVISEGNQRTADGISSNTSRNINTGDGNKDDEHDEENDEEDDDRGATEKASESVDEGNSIVNYSNISLSSVDWKSKLSHLYSTPLPESHPCKSFTHPPPPPPNRRRSGPRPCPVCYLPVKKCLKIKDQLSLSPNPVLKYLTYANESHPSERMAKQKGKPPKFGGYPTLQDRENSFSIRESMEVHCGFVWGDSPGVNTGYDISEEDRSEMHACDDIVVASAIFGAYDALQQPINVSPQAKKHVCFFMFVDQQSFLDLLQDGSIPNHSVKKVGLWRIVLVNNIPYTDPRRTGKIPKLLIHRLFPRAKYSIWMDGKLKLVVDPYQVLERFLWRGTHTFAISKHYRRFDMFVEAEANKAAGKYDNVSIDRQVAVYRRDGMIPFSEEKYPIISDVPEGCLIIREHSPLSNLFGCLWFNEVDRFTSRDQICFGYTRDRILSQVPWKINMFLDCERRNFVIQGYHKPVMKEKGLKSSIIFTKDYIKLKKKDKQSVVKDTVDTESHSANESGKKKKKKRAKEDALNDQ